MSMDIAKLLKDADQKVQLLYAFNGTGKTRLSRNSNSSLHPKTIVMRQIKLSHRITKFFTITPLPKIYFTGITT